MVKKSAGQETWQSALIDAVTNFEGFRPRAVGKNYPIYRDSGKSTFTDEECYIISALSKI